LRQVRKPSAEQAAETPRSDGRRPQGSRESARTEKEHDLGLGLGLVWFGLAR
jgi:hypothetical protein